MRAPRLGAFRHRGPAALAVVMLAGPVPAEPVEGCIAAEDPWARIAACTAVIESGDWPGASAAWAYSNRAVAHAALGNPIAAFADHDRAVALDPSDPVALNNRANSHAAFREFDRAMRDYDRALALDPGYVNARFNRAGLRLTLRRFEVAAADYAAVLERAPDFAAAHLGLAQAHCGSGAVEASIAARRAAIAAGALSRETVIERLRRTGYLTAAGGADLDAALRRWTEAGCP